MTTRIAKSAITILALLMLTTSAGLASAASATGASGGSRGGSSGGSNSSSSGPDSGGDESDNDWLSRVIRTTDEREPGRKPKPKRKVVRLFSDNCQWVKKQRPDGSTYAFRFAIECEKKVRQ
ncbi:MAG: hypothetical protein QM488_04170 [Rhizobiaceae bacterium]